MIEGQTFFGWYLYVSGEVAYFSSHTLCQDSDNKNMKFGKMSELLLLR